MSTDKKNNVSGSKRRKGPVVVRKTLTVVLRESITDEEIRKRKAGEKEKLQNTTRSVKKTPSNPEKSTGNYQTNGSSYFPRKSSFTPSSGNSSKARSSSTVINVRQDTSPESSHGLQDIGQVDYTQKTHSFRKEEQTVSAQKETVFPCRKTVKDEGNSKISDSRPVTNNENGHETEIQTAVGEKSAAVQNPSQKNTETPRQTTSPIKKQVVSKLVKI